MTEPIEVAAQPLAADRVALWEDFIDIFYAPSNVFARRQNGSAALPLFIVSFLIAILFFLNSGAMQPIMDAEFNRAMGAAMRQNPNLTPEAMARFRDLGMRMQQVGIFIFLPITILCIGLFLWLVGKLFEARQTLKAAIIVSAYSYVPRVIESVLNGLQALMMDPSGLNGRFRISLGVGRFIDPDNASPVLLAIVGRIDVFTIWVTVLLAIGLAVTGNIPRVRAAMAAALIWVIGALPLVFQAIRSL
jgi:hypothetical protein